MAPHTMVAQAGDSASAALKVAAQTITPAELASHLRALAAESLRGRATSGPALEAAARYIAVQLRQDGLQVAHAMGDTMWVKHFPLPGARRQLEFAKSSLQLVARLRRAGYVADALDERGRPVERTIQLDFALTARLAADSIAESTLSFSQEPREHRPTPILVVSGRLTAAALPCDHAPSQLVLYVPPVASDSVTHASILKRLTQCAPVLVVAAADTDGTAFAARRVRSAEIPRAVFDWYADAPDARAWAAYADPRSVAPLLQIAGLDLAAAWADTTPRVRVLPTVSASASLAFAPPIDTNGIFVAGILPGSDSVAASPSGSRSLPLLSQSYLVYTASLDGTVLRDRAGTAKAVADATDTELSVAGLLALARAFTLPGVRPRRSVVFLATSGARQHAASSNLISSRFTGSLLHVPALSLALEQLGGLRGDTLPLAGLNEFAFARRPEWLAQLHPELGLTVVDGGTVLRPGTDAYAFARRGLVSLALAPTGSAAEAPLDTVGAHAAGARADAIKRADAAVSVTRFALYLGQELANALEWPHWEPTARAAWARALGR